MAKICQNISFVFHDIATSDENARDWLNFINRLSFLTHRKLLKKNNNFSPRYKCIREKEVKRWIRKLSIKHEGRVSCPVAWFASHIGSHETIARYRHVSSHLILPHIASFEECQSIAFPSRLNFESNFHNFVSRGKKKKIRNLGNFELPPREEASIFQKFLSSRRCTHPSSPISNHVGRCGTMSIVLHCRARLKRNQT